MKKNLFFVSLFCGLFLSLSPVQAQMFYNPKSSFDAAGSSTSGGGSIRTPEEPNYNKKEEPFEKIVSNEIRERIRPDAAYILGEPDDVYCYGIARKSPRKRDATIDGYAHIGNCGTLNDVGLAEVQKQLLKASSYDMTVSKISSCVVTPRLALRFRKNFDFVDLILAGGNCPGVIFIYGGDNREFFAKPIGEWLETFITAVSNDMEPLNQEETKEGVGLFRRREDKPKETGQKQAPAGPKQWGRRFEASSEE